MTVAVYAKGLTVDVRDTPTVPVSGNWAQRKSAPGVVRVFGFDDAADLAGGFDENWGYLPGDLGNKPTLDANVKCPGGASSLRFDIPSLSAANAGGSWWANASTDLSVRFGEHSAIYVQGRFRWNSVMAQTLFKATDGSPQGGTKFFDIVASDMYGGPHPDGYGISKFYSSSEAKVVVQTWYQHRNPIVYRYFDGGTDNLMSPTAAGDIAMQNGMPSCLYSHSLGLPSGANVPGCWSMLSDEWITLQMGITTGANGVVKGSAGNNIDVWLDSTVSLWAAREGQASQLLVDWRPGVPGYKPLWRGPASDDQRLGKVYIMPYMTSKDPTQVHGLGHVWADELIMSTQRIADPT